jgi:sortase A
MPKQLVMRLLRNSIRFTFIVLAVMLLAAPVTASTQPAGLTPGPSRQPSNHVLQSAAWTMGELRIPRIDLTETVRLGVSPSVLNQGVGQWVGTSEPGTEGNVVLAGHRTTYSRPFSDLDDLRVGDPVYMTNSVGDEILYRVAETIIVDPTDMWITFDRDRPTLTMFACHPKGTAEKRIVVIAELVSEHRMS